VPKAHKSVYVMRTETLGGGLTKVGVAECVSCRNRTLRIHRKLKDLRVVKSWQRNGDAYPIERRCHKALAEYRVGNEWFNCSAAQACRVVARVIREFEAG
jgi:hypothetical protein